jgi:hypothetical protein
MCIPYILSQIPFVELTIRSEEDAAFRCVPCLFPAHSPFVHLVMCVCTFISRTLDRRMAEDKEHMRTILSILFKTLSDVNFVPFQV